MEAKMTGAIKSRLPSKYRNVFNNNKELQCYLNDRGFYFMRDLRSIDFRMNCGGYYPELNSFIDHVKKHIDKHPSSAHKVVSSKKLSIWSRIWKLLTN